MTPPAPRLGGALQLKDAAAFLLFAALGLHHAGRLQASGDEPHYLLMAQSLWREGDLDLRDNYERQDFLDYTPGPLVPHYGAPRRDGRPFPAHSPGLPALLAPLYALGGRRACLLAMAALAALLAAESRRLALLLTGDARAAWSAWACAAGPPILFYSFHVYTEVPSGLALALGLRLLLSSPGTGGAAAAGLAACALPWLHVKMAPAAAVLGVLALGRLGGTARLAFLGVAAAGAAGFAGYYQSVFGQPTPLAIYGGLPADVASSTPGRAAAGLLLDRSFGLLPYAPAYLLSLAGAASLARGRAAGRAALLAVAVAVLAPALGWRMWWGGQCPPARFLVPLVPALAVAFAAAVAEGRGRLPRARRALIGAGWALALFLAWRPEDRLLLNRGDRPTRLWEYVAPAAGRWLPSLVSREPRDTWLAVGWASGVALLLAWDGWRGRTARRPRAPGSAGGP